MAPDKEDVPRTTEDINLSQHAWNKAKQRDISAFEIIKTIELGKIDFDKPKQVLAKDPEKEHLVAYDNELPISLWVILDIRNDKIVTAYYDDAEGAVQGSITNTDDYSLKAEGISFSDMLDSSLLDFIKG